MRDRAFICAREIKRKDSPQENSHGLLILSEIIIKQQLSVICFYGLSAFSGLFKTVTYMWGHLCTTMRDRTLTGALSFQDVGGLWFATTFSNSYPFTGLISISFFFFFFCHLFTKTQQG